MPPLPHGGTKPIRNGLGPMTQANERKQKRSRGEEPMVCMTLPWREMDSNFQFLVARGCVPFGDGSLPTGLPKATEKGPKPPKP